MNRLFDANSLSGQRHLVTGASSGIGLATARLLSACGAAVTVAGRDEARLAAALDTLSGSGHLASAHDFRDADETAAWAKSLSDAGGPFHGIFHAAGVELIRPVRMTKQAQIDELMRSACYAAFGLARAASQKGGLVDGGALLFMSSVAGSSGQTGMTAYSAAKAAVDGMVRSLACELAPRRIRVNSLAAGAVRTPMHERLMHGATEQALSQYEASHPLGFGEPEDVAQAAVFLLGPGARWITGTTMAVDGGYLSR